MQNVWQILYAELEVGEFLTHKLKELFTSEKVALSELKFGHLRHRIDIIALA